jgi:RNA-splicing ligase RtcB
MCTCQRTCAGQPVLIGGTMGTCSYVLTGTQQGTSSDTTDVCARVMQVIDCAQTIYYSVRLVAIIV